MAKKSFEDTLEENLLRFTQGSVKDLLAEARAPVSSASQAEKTAKTTVAEPPAVLAEGDCPRAVTPKGDTVVTPNLDAVKPGDTMVTPGFTMSCQTVTPNGDTTSARMVTPGVTKITRLERSVLRYIESVQETVVPLKKLALNLDIPHTTLYKIIPRLRTKGLILAEKDGNDGTYMKFLAWEKVTPKGDTSCVQMVTPKGDTKSFQRVTPKGDTTPPSKIDREKNLSISQERIALTWPHLARTGFGASQVDQIAQALAELSMPSDRVVQGLHHAEWELEHGKMLDKQGRPVADPCSWVFRSLASQGYYRRPAGYISAEEQAAKDAEAEAKAISMALQKAEQAQFEAWRDSLTPDALENAMGGHPGGNRDAWLRRVWRDRQTVKKTS